MQQKNLNSPTFTITKAQSISCYLCGRQFGTKGFSFHYKQCAIKYQNEQKLRSSKDISKKPQPPSGLQQILKGQFTKIFLQNFNKESQYIFKYKVLSACKYCNRTFNYQSLIIHMKGCDMKANYKETNQNVQSNQQKYKNPKSLVCCVCGQRFGTLSLRIHYPQCIKKFKFDQFRKHKKQSDRRNPPIFSCEDQQLINSKTQWTEQQMEQFNQRSTNNYRENGMVQCKNCKRKFFDQQLSKHQKNCVLINGILNKVETVNKKSVQARKPKVVMCFICGRQYGLSSISIHIPNCKQLFVKQQELKPKNQRKKLPQLSLDIITAYKIQNIESWSSQKLGDYNKIVSQVYNQKSLTKCYICNRTFFEQSLQKHLKNCESNLKDVKKLDKFKKHVQSNPNLFGQNFIQNVIQINKQANKNHQIHVNKKCNLLMCYLCGRQFGTKSISIHMVQCHKKNQGRINTIQKGKILQQKYDYLHADKWSSEQVQIINKQAYEIYKNQSLFQCKFCHRTFFQESLKKHVKFCQKQANNTKKQKGLRRAQTMKDTLKILNQYEENMADIEVIQLQNVSKRHSEKIIEEDEEQCYSSQEKANKNSLQDEEQMQIEPIQIQPMQIQQI